MSTASENIDTLRIIFMGTPEFAVESLKHILEAGYTVAGVVTAPDRPAGRGRKIQESAVKQFAKENDLKVLQPTNLKDETFVQELKELNANLQVVVAFRMLPQVVWQMPKYGTFNLHASLLPQYRGAAPINWAIINGETETGATTFFIDDKIDTGHIILQVKEPIKETDNAGSLHDRLIHSGAKLVVETCKRIATGQVETFPQVAETLKMAPKIHRETCKIDWNFPMEKIHDHIRGLSPYPGAWTLLDIPGQNEMVVKVFQSSMEQMDHNDIIGDVLTSKETLKVAVSGGYLSLTEVQLPGKKRMKTADILRGFQIGENSKMR